jgi:hypothetical protein
MNVQVKEIFSPAFSLFGKNEDLEEISKASLIML